ncbi:unnamed protein product [Urochloa humidicola]
MCYHGLQQTHWSSNTGEQRTFFLLSVLSNLHASSPASVLKDPSPTSPFPASRSSTKSRSSLPVPPFIPNQRGARVQPPSIPNRGAALLPPSPSLPPKTSSSVDPSLAAKHRAPLTPGTGSGLPCQRRKGPGVASLPAREGAAVAAQVG